MRKIFNKQKPKNEYTFSIRFATGKKIIDFSKDFCTQDTETLGWCPAEST